MKEKIWRALTGMTTSFPRTVDFENISSFDVGISIMKKKYLELSRTLLVTCYVHCRLYSISIPIGAFAGRLECGRGSSRGLEGDTSGDTRCRFFFLLKLCFLANTTFFASVRSSPCSTTIAVTSTTSFTSCMVVLRIQ